MSENPVVGKDFDASKIGFLIGLEAVRKKTGMYFGSTDERGLHHCIWYLVQEAVDQHLNGHGTTIDVVIEADGSISIEDDGPGVSVKPRNRSKEAFIEFYLGSLHFGDGGRKGPGLAILHGVGPNCVNAVSEWFRAETSVEGNTYVIEFREGKVTRPLELVGPSGKTGTRFTFKPDPAIFRETTVFNAITVQKRLMQIAGLFPGFKTSMRDRLSKRTLVKSFQFKNGLEGYLSHLLGKRKLLHPPLRITEKVNAFSQRAGKAVDIGIDICFSLVPLEERSVFSCFTNATENHLGGSHKEGLSTGVLQALSEVGALERFGFLGKDRFDAKNLKRGMVAAISILHPEPSYGGCTKHELDSPEVRHAVYDCVHREFLAFLLAHPEDLGSIKSDRKAY